jgi:8-oxo-dGTP pyrophosphatase MutT (NUDIX family)
MVDNKELFRISITGIIYRDNADGLKKYLITRRALTKKAFPGKWTVPGGGLSTDDFLNTPKTTGSQWYNAVEKALKREIKEESGLEVDSIKYLIDIAHVLPDGTPSVILSFYCRYVSGEVVLDEDTIEAKWVAKKEAKDIDLIEGIAEEIAMVDDILSGK